jgi:hypothetical protein
MKRSSQTRFSTFALLTVLMLLALVIGAQAALAAHFSNGSAVVDPAAGTQGRGGVDQRATVVAVGTVSTSSLAGTAGRGGASLAVVTAPRAGTSGRGGVAPVADTAAPTVASREFVGLGRGSVSGGPLGVQRRLAVSSLDSNSAGWIAAGVSVALIVVVAGFFLWASGRRRAWQQQSSLAAFCMYNPADSLC